MANLNNKNLIANRSGIIAAIKNEMHTVIPDTIYIPNKNGEHEGTLSFDEKEGIVSLIVHRDAVNEVVELDLEFFYEAGTVMPAERTGNIVELVAKFNDLADADILTESQEFRTMVQEYKDFLMESCGLTLQGAKFFFAEGKITVSEWQDEEGEWHEDHSRKTWLLNTEGL